jgi:hypothetical protein
MGITEKEVAQQEYAAALQCTAMLYCTRSVE